MQRAKTPAAYFASPGPWKAELNTLRKVLKETGLKEEIKWGGPCYTLDGKNIVGIGGFKSYFGLWFHQGALLKDKESVLINAQEGRTKALRQWRMTSAKEIRPAVIKAYVKEAITHSKAGKEIKPDRAKPLVIPPELKKALAKIKTADANFKKLTPGLQREYADYIADAKQAATKERRLEKILPMIKAGKGLNDRYR
jgi:uncharacterized protein YdeI (YjbR/CyaY-like superfamily)